jgi:hypothetical protein
MIEQSGFHADGTHHLDFGEQYKNSKLYMSQQNKVMTDALDAEDFIFITIKLKNFALGKQ